MLGIAELVACGIAPTQARAFAGPLDQAFRKFGITTKPRIAAFIAQAAHESARFTRLEESLFYRTPERIRAIWPARFSSVAEAAQFCRNPEALANRVYSNRLGNGDESSGDGWKYRGRGLFQITGRTNYKVASDALGANYLHAPTLVAHPVDACLTAGWYWTSVHGNALADAGLIDELTRKINGPGMVGADDRRSLYDDALQAL